MILEGARQLDEARANLQASELKETKIKKELKKEKWDILVTSQKLFPAITTIFVTVFFAVAIPDWKFQCACTLGEIE